MNDEEVKGEESELRRVGEPRADKMICRELHPKASVPLEAESAPRYTIDFRSSDQTLDRYEEVITVAGWKLENYQKNPIVQNAHNYGSLSDTIGRSLITELRQPGTGDGGPYLFQRVQFAVEENPMAKVAYGLYKGGFLNAVSVGFIPLRWENGSQEAGYRRRYLEQDLLEVSAVSIPANPNALTLALKAGAIERSDLKELEGLLRGLSGSRNASGDERVFTAEGAEVYAEAAAAATGDGRTPRAGESAWGEEFAGLARQISDIRGILRRA